MKKICALLCGAVLLLCALSACASPLSREEAAEVLKPLVEKSDSLNEIFFGSGLPQETSEALLSSYLKATGQTKEQAMYLPVLRSCAFQSRAALQEACREVYSDAYVKTLMQIGFEGVADGDDDEVSLGQATKIHARFLEKTDVYQKGDSVLCVRVNLAEESLALARTDFLYDTLRVIKSGRSDGKAWVRVTLDCRVLDEAGQVRTTISVTLRLVEEKNGWRLDSPTCVSRSVYESEEET